MTSQHYRIDTETAIALYQSGDLTAKGALKIYFRIRLKEGWSITLKPPEIRNLFHKKDKSGLNKPMPRSTFWEALNKLAEEGTISYTEPDSLTISRPADRGTEFRTGPKIPDDGPEFRTTAQNSGRRPRIPDKESPDPAPRLNNSGPSYSYQIFLKSLSDTERENWENFLSRKITELPEKPALPEKWATKNLEELKNLWNAHKRASIPPPITREFTEKQLEEAIHLKNLNEIEEFDKYNQLIKPWNAGWMRFDEWKTQHRSRSDNETSLNPPN